MFRSIFLMFRSIFATSAGLLLSSILTLAQFRTVTVQNANGNPVPTTIQNTPSVNVANAPNVTVANPTTSVTVNNTVGSPVPTAAQGTTAVTGTVNVGNAVGAPVPVRDNDLGGRHPFKHSGSFFFTNGNCGAADTFTSPANKELVIEQLSMDVGGLTSQSISIFYVNTSLGGDSNGMLFPAISYVNYDGTTHYLTSQHVTLYADASTTVAPAAYRNGNACAGTGSGTYVLEGYTVDLP